MIITKANGEKVPFDPDKLRHSLANAGASEKAIDLVLAEINRMLVPGISTRKIYHRAFQLLKKYHRPTAARYKLKKAIMELGPSGYPFEQFIGEILAHQGYEVQVGVMEAGKCIMHEVDVIAENQERRIAVECKFGNSQEKKVTSQVPLYINSRFHDLSNAWMQNPQWAEKEHKGWIVTNTTFTGDALRYGTCAGLNMVAWNHPKKGSLKQLIDSCHLYPVTVLVSLTKAEKRQLLKKGLVLCSHLVGKEQLLRELQVSQNRIQKAMKEVEALLC
jgi:Holliday junction resolvase-like predicted endonuclease